MEERKLTCIVCPIGCRLNITLDNGRIGNISGNRCKRGNAYAKEECTAPKRMLTSSVWVTGGIHPLVPVKSERPIPKELIMQCMETIRRVKVQAPVRTGDIIIKDVCGTGVNIVATRSILRNEQQEVC
jgi:CxxC motif-containing protein